VPVPSLDKWEGEQQEGHPPVEKTMPNSDDAVFKSLHQPPTEETQLNKDNIFTQMFPEW